MSHIRCNCKTPNYNPIGRCLACGGLHEGSNRREPSTTGKVIISSAALYKFLSERMEFWKEEVKITWVDDDLIIDGFKGLMCHAKEPFETTVYVEKLRQLRRMLGTISDQPITVHFNGFKIEIQHITI